MIDREKVIQAITNCTDEALVCSKGRDCPYWQDDRHIVCWNNLMKDALALLKEQEPKQVVITTNSYGTRFYHCPRCNHDFYAYPRQMYCGQCGQAVKWNGFD